MSTKKQRKYLAMYADGGVISALKNRQKVLDTAEANAIAPTPTPIAPTPVPPTPAPTTVAIVPGLADQMAAKQAARVKAEADAAAAALAAPPKKKILGLFADGGAIGDEPVPMHGHLKRRGMRGYADGGLLWGGPETDNASTLRYAQKLAKGGVVGGMIHGKGGPTEDKQPILASPGEFVLPADTVDKVGVKSLRRLIAETHTPVHGAPGLADGDSVWQKLYGGAKDLFGRGKAGVQAGVAAAAETPLPEVAPSIRPSGTTPRGTAWNPNMNREAAVARTAPLRAPLPPASVAASTSMFQGAANALRANPYTRAGGAIVGAAAPYLGYAGAALGADKLIDVMAEHGGPGYDNQVKTNSDIPTVSNDLRRASANYAPLTTTALPDNNFGNDRNPAYRETPGPGSALAPASEGEGYVRNAAGRTLRSSDAGSLQFPSTVGQPSTDEVNANARAQINAMNAQKAAAGEAEGRRLNEMGLRGSLAGAKYAYDTATSGSNLAHVQQDLARGKPGADLPITAAAGKYAAAQNDLREQQNRGLVRETKNAENTNELAKANIAASASRYGADQGLRGNVYTANQGAQNARAQLMYQMGEKNLDRQDKNRTERAAWEKDAFSKTVVGADGKTSVVTDPEAQQNWQNFVVSYAVNNPAFAKANKSKSFDEMTTTDLEPAMRAYKEQTGLTQAAQGATDSSNQQPTGLPTGARTAPLKWGDWLNFSRDNQENSISFPQNVASKLNPLNSGTPADKTIALQFNHGGVMKEQKYMLADIIKDPRLAKAAIAQLPPNQAAELVRMIGPPQGLR